MLRLVVVVTFLGLFVVRYGKCGAVCCSVLQCVAVVSFIGLFGVTLILVDILVILVVRYGRHVFGNHVCIDANLSLL